MSWRCSNCCREVTILTGGYFCPQGCHTKVSIEPEKTIKERIINLLNDQCAKGDAKYGHALDDCPDDKYDWKLMAMEELIDLVQYQQKEIVRLERLLNP